MPYFDHNATTPIHHTIQQDYFSTLKRHWRNPSSLYPKAGKIRQHLEQCREELSEILGIDNEKRLIFTSGATESNHLVIQEHRHQALVTGAIEHPSLMEPAKHSKAHTLLQVSLDGCVLLEDIEKRIQAQRPSLISLMAANNETGVLQPWQEAQKISKKHGIPFHTDASQWLGKLPLHGLDQCDWVSGCAHKFGGPKGVGFLIVPENFKFFRNGMRGGPQENGYRAGTENYPSIQAMLASLKHANSQLDRIHPSQAMKDTFEETLLKKLPGTHILGKNVDRLWNTSMLIMPHSSNLKWLVRLADLGFELSTGSACSTGKQGSSHVLQAMGVESSASLRVSAGWDTTQIEWEDLLKAFIQVDKQLKTQNRVRKKVI